MGAVVVEVAERFGVEPERWICKPWCWTLWNYYHLQELDRRQQWVLRMQRLESADLTAVAFHEPEGLQRERNAALADASGATKIDVDEWRARGLELLHQFEAGKVLPS